MYINDSIHVKIPNYAPGSKLAKNIGGRGKKAAGRGVLHLDGRRRSKYPAAEKMTMLWMKQRRAKGIRITSRILSAKMRESVLHHQPNNEAARRFKASAGWQKRFMGRYGIVWRRRNDNAKKGVAELLLPVAAFINDLRA